MQPAVPDEPFEQPSVEQRAYSADDIGAFDQGTEFSRWALARYIVGRVILERVSWGLLVVAIIFLVLAAVFEWVLDSTFLAVLAVLVALFDLLLRAALRAVLRRLMGADSYGPLEDRVRAITGGATSDVLAEMRRVGLPSRLLTIPFIAFRLAGRRRKETMERMRRFDVERAVPKAKRDELHMVLQEAIGRQQRPPAA